MSERPGTVNVRSFHIGVDLGQRVDHTGFVVVEQQVVVGQQWDPVRYAYERERRMWIRMIERVQLGQGFDEVVAETVRLSNSAELQAGTVTTTVDATGLGIVVSEYLERSALRGTLFPVVITGGLEGRYRKGYYPTPRTELLIGVQRAFEKEKLRVAAELPMWEALRGELLGMRKVQSARGPRFETQGKHDDLVFALALALFGAKMRMPPLDLGLRG